MPPFDETGFLVQVASSKDRDDVFVELAFNRATVAELVSDPSTGRTELTLLARRAVGPGCSTRRSSGRRWSGRNAGRAWRGAWSLRAAARRVDPY